MLFFINFKLLSLWSFYFEAVVDEQLGFSARKDHSVLDHQRERKVLTVLEHQAF